MIGFGLKNIAVRHMSVMASQINSNSTVFSTTCLGLQERKHQSWPVERKMCRFMMMSSNGNICCVTGHLHGEFTGPRWIPRTQRLVRRRFDVVFVLRPNKRLSKQSWSWWFETPPSLLWRHCNVAMRTWETGPVWVIEGKAEWNGGGNMSMVTCLSSYTVRCRYNAVNFLQNPHNIHTIAHPWGTVIATP